jgi:hypothetical protein
MSVDGPFVDDVLSRWVGWRKPVRQRRLAERGGGIGGPYGFGWQEVDTESRNAP